MTSNEKKENKVAFLYVLDTSDEDIDKFIHELDSIDLPFDIVITNKKISFLSIDDLKILFNMLKDIIEKYESKPTKQD